MIYDIYLERFSLTLLISVTFIEQVSSGCGRGQSSHLLIIYMTLYVCTYVINNKHSVIFNNYKENIAEGWFNTSPCLVLGLSEDMFSNAQMYTFWATSL